MSWFLNDVSLLETRCASSKETFLGVLLVLLTPLIVFSTPGFNLLFDQFMWQDEHHTALLVAHFPPSKIYQALAASLDHFPPAGYLIFWIFSQLQKLNIEYVHCLRLCAAWFGLASLLIFYLMLRRCVGMLAASIGVLSVLSNREFQSHLFEARAYPLLWFFLLLSFYCIVEYRTSKENIFLGGYVLSSVLCVATHYFGVIFLTIGLCLEILVNRNFYLQRFKISAGILCLPALTFAAHIPLILAQRTHLEVSSWMHPLTVNTFQLLVAYTFPVSSVSLPIVIGILLPRVLPINYTQFRETHLVSLLSQIAVPFVLTVFSIFVQPAYLPRYSLTASFGSGAAIAIVASAQYRRSAVLMCIYLTSVMIFSSMALLKEVKREEEDLNSRVEWLESLDSREVILSDVLYAYLPVVERAPHLKERIPVLLYDRDTLPKVLRDRRFLRTFIKGFSEHYGLPKVLRMPESELPDRFFLLSFFPTKGQGAFIYSLQFPNYKFSFVRDFVVLFERRDSNE